MPCALVRRLLPRELAAAEALKRTVVAEVWAPRIPILARRMKWRGGRPPGRGLEVLTMFGAVANGRLVGVAGAGHRRIFDLWVAAEWRGRGIGGCLLASVERLLARRGTHVARLTTAPFAEAALALYLGRGWRIERRTRHKSTHHTVLGLAKRLR